MKKKIMIILLILSVLYIFYIFFIVGTRTKIGEKGLFNYMMEGSAFLPAGIIFLLMAIGLFYLQAKGKNHISAAADQKISPSFAIMLSAIILLTIAILAFCVSGRYIMNYVHDKNSAPVYITLSDISVRNVNSASGKVPNNYVIRGIDEAGNTRGFYLSRSDKDVADALLTNKAGGTVSLTYYNNSHIIASIEY